ncbi:hypothetical protein H9635_18890 [Solibacillus sp. A46]|uniref:Uncharacterized protein n=1 Tax=Solibacillus faecavium TaxID=2762221 RepID=A0ABR8Y3N9_9BACL|nr:hypothetical protein [Solibacillus faecavium]MBD8038815.1 hypothetical protein [Solibacillus faecavium]
MKIFATISLLFGIIFTFIGVLPFIFSYPFSNGPHSGPSNAWELILMISYDGKGWYLIIGIALLLVPNFLVFKRKNLN